MKTEAIQSPRVSLLQVINDSQTPVDQGLLRILYKGDTSAPATQPKNIQKEEATRWVYAWFANYE